ncbi:GNAT family N-acetyltransferase [Phenylobacterium sp.]|uniref:GNAT family N-acetyltransferase n=1 Tax=Phenylobacterium sp. TaxID=1871053 RepID=UPI002736A603|nr:GNAT family protein [Phenylobacterium sp.]MDP3854308.1 GNAT family protein [Phenylobacterium sp.]
MTHFPIRTKRLLLRDFRADDFDAIHEYAVDEAVVRFMDWGPNTPQQTQEALDRWFAEQAQVVRLGVNLAIEVVAERRLIGSIRMDYQGKETADLGYSLHSGYWRQGYGSEAAAAMLELGFERFGLHRIWATCDVGNAGSYGVMEKIGMRREGTFLQDTQVKGRWRDTHLYAVLAQEWAARRGPPV